MISRYFISFNLAGLITFSLFYGMQLLIANGELVLKDTGLRIMPTLGVIRDVEEITKKIEAPLKPDVEVPPETQIIKSEPRDGGDPTSTPVTFTPKVIVLPAKINRLFEREGDFTVVVRPAPQYPSDMAARGIEGFVRVQYTVTESGSTDDVVVINSSNRGFERNAVKAVQKFKFKPRIVDGQPQAVSNVLSLIEFKLEG